MACQWCQQDVGERLVALPRDCGLHLARLCYTCGLGALLVQRGAVPETCPCGDLWVVVTWA